MNKLLSIFLFFILLCPFSSFAQEHFVSDKFETSDGELVITSIGHASLMLAFHGKIIYVDPFGKVADYSIMPKADIILITHEHYDHFDLPTLNKVRTDKTDIVLTETCAKQIHGATIMHNGDAITIQDLKIEAVPAYNIVHKRDNNQPFHPKGIGNGYILTFGDKRIYIAGDTENIPEMKELRHIDIAFLPMNLPYTMTPEMVADAARAFRPKILYPYHYSGADPDDLLHLLQHEKDIEVRIRNLQ